MYPPRPFELERRPEVIDAGMKALKDNWTLPTGEMVEEIYVAMRIAYQDYLNNIPPLKQEPMIKLTPQQEERAETINLLFIAAVIVGFWGTILLALYGLYELLFT